MKRLMDAMYWTHLEAVPHLIWAYVLKESVASRYEPKNFMWSDLGIVEMLTLMVSQRHFVSYFC